MKRLAAALLLTLLAGAARAQTPPEAFVWIALNDINAYYADPDDPTNRPPLVKTPPAGMIRAVDISHDGKPDWLIDYQNAGISGVCGTGGCLRRLYVSDGDAYVRAFDQQALDLRFSTVGGEPRIEAWVHHLNCAAEVKECTFAWAWDPKALRLVERAPKDGRTRFNGPGFSPLDEAAERAPNTLSEWATSERRICAVDYGPGYAVQDAVLTSIADIDGDGKRDWVGVPATRCSPDETAPGYLVFLSGAENDVALAYTAEPGTFIELDIATTPARLYAQPACEYGQACPPERALIVIEATRTLALAP